MMPRMDGPATLVELAKIIDLETRLVLFMTAKVQEKEIEYYKSIGATGVIMKPFDPMTLPDQLQEYWTSFQNSWSV